MMMSRLSVGLFLFGVFSPDFAAAWTVGNRLWDDWNANGIQDAGEPNLAVAVPITLQKCSAGPTYTWVAGGSYTGTYTFNNVPTGSYRLVFGKPAGWQRTPWLKGTDRALDSDADPSSGATACYNIASNKVDYDAGYYRYASIGNRLWVDTNANGVQGVVGVGEAANLAVPVTVTLQKCSAGPVYTTVTSGSYTGLYTFSTVVPGSYRVVFGLPATWWRSPWLQGGNTVWDSDASPTTGATACFTVKSGQVKTDVDAGYYKYASVGNKLWWDKNKNGLQDWAEPNLSIPVPVRLEACAAGPTYTWVAGSSYTGTYTFSVKPGTYRVVFGLPATWLRSPAWVGANRAIDSDPNTGTGATPCFTLVSGQTYWDVDAGYYKP